MCIMDSLCTISRQGIMLIFFRRLNELGTGVEESAGG